MKNRVLIVSLIIMFFLMLSAVSAVDNNITSDNLNSNNNDDVISSVSEDELSNDDGNFKAIGDVKNSSDIKTSLKSTDSNVVKGKYFSAQLTYENGSGIAEMPVQFTLGSVVENITTDENGTAKFLINTAKGTYTISYMFSQEGYTASSAQSKILVIENSESSIKASNYVAYVGVKNPFTVTLSAGGVNLAGRTVKFALNGKVYSVKTNSKGQATLNINIAKGTYKIKYSYAGEQNINPIKGSAKITVKKGMPTKIKKANSVKYYSNTKGAFKVKLTDVRGNALANKKVVFAVKKKKYVKKTNANGVAGINLKLSKGTYKIAYAFGKTSVYNKAKAHSTIKVVNKPVKMANNGFWLFASDMKKVSLNQLAKYGTKHIFLNFISLEWYGQKYVESFIAKAKAKGMKVHIWMQIFYEGSWISPVYSDGSFKYSFFNKKVAEAVKYAKLKGVAGVHMDYIRFPGDAYKHTNGVKAINYFTKQVSKAVHDVNSKLIVSAAVMPETNDNKYYYGQDIPTMAKYLDVIIPMVYKGNYNAGVNWIKSTTSWFVKHSKGAEVWTGLQSYGSDSNVVKLSASELRKDSYYAALGGACGVILFRWGLVNFFNFNNIH